MDKEIIELMAKWLFHYKYPQAVWGAGDSVASDYFIRDARELLALRGDCKWCDEDPNVALSREEALACILALDKTKPYGWRNKALKKLELAMGMEAKKP